MDLFREVVVQQVRHAQEQGRRINTVGALLTYLEEREVLPNEQIEKNTGLIIKIWRDMSNSDSPGPGGSPNDEGQDDRDNVLFLDEQTGRPWKIPAFEALYPPAVVKISFQRSPGFLFATCRHTSNGPATFIQAKTLRNNSVEPDEDGTVIVQWKREQGSLDQTMPSTRCFVLEDAEAKQFGMEFDILFGTEYDQELDHQPRPPKSKATSSASDVGSHDSLLFLEAVNGAHQQSRYPSGMQRIPPSELAPVTGKAPSFISAYAPVVITVDPCSLSQVLALHAPLPGSSPPFGFGGGCGFAPPAAPNGGVPAVSVPTQPNQNSPATRIPNGVAPRGTSFGNGVDMPQNKRKADGEPDGMGRTKRTQTTSV